jgi:DNA primase
MFSIMDISEQVLISTLAQLLQKDTTEVGKSKGRIQHVRNCKSENPAAEKLMFFIV